MTSFCTENDSTYIGLKKTVMLGFFTSSMAIASPEYNLDVIDRVEPVAVYGERLSIFDQDVDSVIDDNKAAVEDSEEYSNAKKTLEAISEMKEDWDGYGAEPISKLSLDLAARFLKAMTVVRGLIVGWDVSPTGRKTVQVEKTVGDDYFEIEFFDNGKMFCSARKNGEWLGLEQNRIDDVVQWVANDVS